MIVLQPVAQLGADAFRFFQEPDAHFEAEISRGERADRADVDGVERIIVFESLAGMRGQDGVTAAIDKPEDVVVCDFVAEPDAARAEDAALVIECDARPEHDVLSVS